MRYRLLGRVAATRVADVYRAELDDGRVVAVKQLRRDHARDPAFVERFVREAEIARSLDHPNLTRYLAIERDGERVALITEWVEGVTLRRVHAEAPCPIELAVFVAAEICAALDHLHRAGIVHRDIAPQNILIGWDGGVRVTDFGIAKGEGLACTTDLLMHGTVGYASPEQAQGQAVDARSDLFSAGVLLYELLTGCGPFGRGVAEYMPRINRGDVPEPPSAHRPDLPRALDAAVMRSLAHDPAERYPSARDVLADLPPCPAGRAELVTLLRPLRPAAAPSRAGSRPIALGVLAGVAAALGLWWAIEQATSDAQPAADLAAEQRVEPDPGMVGEPAPGPGDATDSDDSSDNRRGDRPPADEPSEPPLDGPPAAPGVADAEAPTEPNTGRASAGREPHRTAKPEPGRADTRGRSREPKPSERPMTVEEMWTPRRDGIHERYGVHP